MTADAKPVAQHSDTPFIVGLAVIVGTYVALLVGLIAADVAYVAKPSSSSAKTIAASDGKTELGLFDRFQIALADPDIRYSIKLTLISCFFTAILSVLVAVPIGYFLSRFSFPGRSLIDAILDIPIVLPPLVVGLSLLILFQFAPFSYFSKDIVYQIPAVVIAQFTVSAAFAVRVMRATFDQIDARLESVALTLGSSRGQAFWAVAVPQSYSGMLTAGTLAWARALGEFGPLLIFAGAMRGKTEVLSTTVFLELSVGNLDGAVVVSLMMVSAAVIVLVIARVFGRPSRSIVS
ncbi:MAG: ABC transporter permease [Planctomycetaceae bacterium]